MKRFAWLSAVALSAGMCTGAFAQVSGTVKFDGKAPERKELPGVANVPGCAQQHQGKPILDESVVVDPKKGGLANAVVFIYGDNVKGDVPKDPVVLDQKGCQYVPHVVSMMVGQKLEANNSDPFLHNVHSLPSDNQPANLAQPTKTAKPDPLKPVKSPEAFKVKCDVHPWMSAWVVALPNPYSAVTGDDGTYEIDVKGLKDGDYTVYVWQERLANKITNEKDEFDPTKLPSKKISIKNGKATADFTIEQKAAAAAPAPGKDVKLASLTTGGTDCCDDGKCDVKDTKKDAKATVAVK